MDAFAVERYRYVLAALAIALVLGLVVTAFLARRSAAPDLDDDAGRATATQVLPHVMLMLVAIVVGTGAVLLLPAATILRYFPGWPVRILVLSAVVLLFAPLIYAWRSRPF